MKLSLIFPSWFAQFGDFSEAAQKVSTFPPLNLCLIAALTKQANWQVQLIDAHIESLDDRALIERVSDFAPDLIGLTATTPFYPNATRLAHILKKEFGKPTMIGGPHATYYGKKAIDDGFDYVVIGECETVFEDFLKQFGKGNRYPNVRGVMMKREVR